MVNVQLDKEGDYYGKESDGQKQTINTCIGTFVSGDPGIQYVGERYGDNGVKEYLRFFTTSYYSPLIADIKERGLCLKRTHREHI